MAEACPRPSCMLNQTPFLLLALGATVAAHPHLPPLPQPRLEAPSSPKDSREGRKRLGLLGWEVAIAKLRYRRRPTSLKRDCNNFTDRGGLGLVDGNQRAELLATWFDGMATTNGTLPSSDGQQRHGVSPAFPLPSDVSTQATST
nr:hypothetical protein Itr_chr05CG14290 [Ipomoea trifida]